MMVGRLLCFFGRYVLRGYVSFGEGKQHLDFET